MFLRMILLFVIVVMFALFITEIIIPLWKGRPLFPLFRNSSSKLATELAVVNQQYDDFELERQIIMRRKELEQRRAELAAQNQEVVQPVVDVQPEQAQGGSENGNNVS